MNVLTAKEISYILAVEDDVEIAYGDKWLSAKWVSKEYSYEDASIWWAELGNITVIARDFSTPCQDPKCPYGGHCLDIPYIKTCSGEVICFDNIKKDVD